MLARTLEAEGYDVTVAADGGGALVEIERSAPDLILLDVTMPGVDGLAVTKRLRGKGDAVPVLLLTARDAVADRVAGLDAGADDYLVKPFATEELLARVRALLRRGRAAGDLLSAGDVTLDLQERAGSRRGRNLDLTPREADLLELLLRNARSVVSREQALAARLGRGRRDRERRRSLRRVPEAQARRPAAHPHGARRRLRARSMRRPSSLRVRVALAAGAAIALATVLLGVAVVALSEREDASSRDAALRAGATQVAQLSASAPALLTAPGALEGRVGSRRLLIEVVDSRGRIVARSGSLGGGVLGTPAADRARDRERPRALLRHEARRRAAARSTARRSRSVGSGPGRRRRRARRDGDRGGRADRAPRPRPRARRGGRRGAARDRDRAAADAARAPSADRPLGGGARDRRDGRPDAAAAAGRARATRSGRSPRRSTPCSPRSSARARRSAASSPTRRTSCARR